MTAKSKPNLTYRFLWLLSLQPMGLLYFWSSLAFLLLYYGIGYRKKVVRNNLLLCFPDWSHQKRKEVEIKYFRFLCDLMVESLKGFSLSEKELNKRVHILNPELLNAIADKKEDVVHLLGHHANWEWFSFAFSLHCKHKLLFIYKPLSNQAMDTAYILMRERFGAQTVPMKQIFKAIGQFRNAPHATYFGSDQSPQPHNDYLWTQFLNRETPVYTGAEAIARKFNIPVVFGKMRRKKRGYYEIEFEILTMNPSEEEVFSITEKHTKTLESLILEEPALWIWSHKRWKFRNERNERAHLNHPLA